VLKKTTYSVCFLFPTFRTVFLFASTRAFESIRRQEPFLCSGHGGTGRRPLSSGGLATRRQTRPLAPVPLLPPCVLLAAAPPTILAAPWPVASRAHRLRTPWDMALAKAVAYGDKAPPGGGARCPFFPRPTSPAT